MFKSLRLSAICTAIGSAIILALCVGAAVAQTLPTVMPTTPPAPPAPSASEPKPFSNFVPTLSRKPTNTLTVTSSVSASSSTTATKNPANSGYIYRWVDSKGKVQYSADVPEDRRSTAKKIDTRGNVVSSRPSASIPVAPSPQPQAQPLPVIVAPAAPVASAPKQAITEREKCDAAWAAYRAAEQCFVQYRTSTRTGSRISDEGLQRCPALAQPQACQ